MSKVKEYNSKKKLRRIEITPAENGFTTETYHDMQDNMGKGASIHTEYPGSGSGKEVKVHNSAHAAAMHVKQHLQRHAAQVFEKGVM